MKLTYFSLLATLIFSVHVNAYTYQTEVLDYTAKSKLIRKSVILRDLTSTTSFEGKYFKIVNAKSDNAIKFSSLNALRAAHVYYHLSRARNYFTKIKGSNLEHLNKQTTIRLDLTNLFDPFAKFAHDDFKKDYNTAVTIPASTDERLDTIPPWNSEIWFRPMKIITSNDMSNRLAASLGDQTTRRNMQMTVLDYQMYDMFYAGLTSSTIGNLTNDSNLIFLAATILGIEAMPAIIRFTGKYFKSSFYIDTAMIPEIIYHEYSHLALSDFIDLQSTPVIEGYANYFAGQISKKFHWGNGPRMYSLDQGRNAQSRDLYSFSLESKIFATSSFVFKVMWGLKDIFNERTDELIYISRQDINRNSDIKNDMINAIFHHMKDIGYNDLYHKVTLHDHLQRMGL